MCFSFFSDFTSTSRGKYTVATFRTDVARQKLLKVFCTSLLPFELVNNPEYRDFINYISSSRWDMPHSRSLADLLDDVGKKMFEKVFCKFCCIDYYFVIIS
jgi:hypothetical protein